MDEDTLDKVLDFIGCLVGSVLILLVLLVVLAIGYTDYNTYTHHVRYCVHATQEYVLVGKVPVLQDVCQQWQDN